MYTREHYHMFTLVHGMSLVYIIHNVNITCIHSHCWYNICAQTCVSTHVDNMYINACMYMYTYSNSFCLTHLRPYTHTTTTPAHTFIANHTHIHPSAHTRSQPHQPHTRPHTHPSAHTGIYSILQLFLIWHNTKNFGLIYVNIT